MLPFQIPMACQHHHEVWYDWCNHPVSFMMKTRCIATKWTITKLVVVNGIAITFGIFWQVPWSTMLSTIVFGLCNTRCSRMCFFLLLFPPKIVKTSVTIVPRNPRPLKQHHLPWHNWSHVSKPRVMPFFPPSRSPILMTSTPTTLHNNQQPQVLPQQRKMPIYVPWSMFHPFWKLWNTLATN